MPNCEGYLSWSQKTEELTDHMNYLAKCNVSRTAWRHSLSSLQALIIYHEFYIEQGKVEESNAILMHLSRMCYILGIHIDTHRFEESCNFNRKIIIRQVTSFDQLFSGSFKFYPNFVGEPPKYDPTLHGPSLHMLPDCMLEFCNSQTSERILKSNLINIRSYFLCKAQKIAQFNYDSSTTTDNNERSCIDQLNSLQKSHNEVNYRLNLLKTQFQNNLVEIEQIERSLSLHYLHFSLIISEYYRLRQYNINSELLTKTLNYCRKLSGFIQNDPNPDSSRSFYYYLISFTYMSIYQHISKDDKNSTIRELKIIMGSVSKKVNEFDNFNNLLFTTAFKKIELG